MAPRFELPLPRITCERCGAEQDDVGRFQRALSTVERVDDWSTRTVVRIDSVEGCWQCGGTRWRVALTASCAGPASHPRAGLPR